MRRLISALFFLITSHIQAQDLKMVVPIGHTHEVVGAVFSPDEKRVLTASWDHSARIWEVRSGALLQPLIGHTAGVNSAKFSPDGNEVVTSSDDNTAIVWNVLTGKALFTLRHHNYVRWAEFSPDGTQILTGSIDSTAKVWSAANGQLLFDLPDLSGFIRIARFSPDGKTILTMAYGGHAEIWSASTGKPLVDISAHLGKTGYACFSPTGKQIAVVTGRGDVTIVDAATSESLVSLAEHLEATTTVVFSHDGKKLATSSAVLSVKVWNAQTGALIKEMAHQHTNLIRSVEFSADDQKLVTASDDRSAKVWDARTGLQITILSGHSDYVYIATFNRKGTTVLTASKDQTAKLWDVASGKIIADFAGHTAQTNLGNFSSDGGSLLTGLQNGTAKLWNMNDGSLTAEFTGHKKSLFTAEFSTDGKKILTGSQDAIKVWNRENFQPICTIKDESDFWAESACFSPDAKKVLAATIYVRAKIFSAEDGSWIKDLGYNKHGITSATFSPDGNSVVASLWDKMGVIWDTRSGHVTDSLQGHQWWVLSAEYDRLGYKVVTGSEDGTAKIWDAASGKMLFDLKGHKKAVASAKFSPDGNWVVTASGDSTAKIWKVADGSLQGDLRGHSQSLRTAVFSPDGTKVATASDDHTAKLWTMQGMHLADLRGHTNWVWNTQFSPDSKRLLTVSGDGSSKIWDAGDGKLIYTFFAVDSTDYINQLPSGYYKCTPDAAKLLHYVTATLDLITFDQLDIKLNRPDLVLAAIGCKDTALNNAVHHAYLKRMERLKIDTSAFSNTYQAPDAVLVNKDNLNHTGDRLVLHLKFADKTNLLDRFNVWVNKVPVYGINGVSLVRQRISKLDTTVIITLSAGINQIEISTINANGVESYHQPVTYQYDTNDTGKVYFLGIAIDHFRSGRNTLQWSVNDIRSLSERFKAKLGQQCIIDTLFDENVTVNKVRQLKELLKRGSVNDKVVVAYSGHGLLSSSYDYYLSAFDVDFDQPQHAGIPYEILEDLLDSIPARQKLMLLDACHSGEIDRAAANQLTPGSGDLDIAALTANAQHQSDQLEQNGGVGNQHYFELMQQLFANVGRNTGATIISSAAGTQYARGGSNNAVFTASILEFLQNNSCPISALKRYVHLRVPAVTHGLQRPTLRAETNAVDWNLW